MELVELGGAEGGVAAADASDDASSAADPDPSTAAVAGTAFWKNVMIERCPSMGGGGGSWQLQDGRTSHYFDSRLHGGGSGFLSSGKLMVPESGKVGFK